VVAPTGQDDPEHVSKKTLFIVRVLDQVKSIWALSSIHPSVATFPSLISGSFDARPDAEAFNAMLAPGTHASLTQIPFWQLCSGPHLAAHPPQLNASMLGLMHWPLHAA
jgi:hypothetical protein